MVLAIGSSVRYAMERQNNMNEILEAVFGWCIAMTAVWLSWKIVTALICRPPLNLPPPSEDAKRGTGNW
jgi:hypothetical protein